MGALADLHVTKGPGDVVEAYVVLAIACRQAFGINMYGVCVCTPWSFSFYQQQYCFGGSKIGDAIRFECCMRRRRVISRSQVSEVRGSLIAADPLESLSF